MKSQRGQNTAEYVMLLGAVLAAFALLNVISGGTVAASLSRGVSEQLLILVTLLRLPI